MHWSTAGLLGAIGLAGVTTSVSAQDPGPIEIVRALALDSADVGSVRVRYVPADREYALQLATLCEAAAAYFEDELGGSFPPQLAVLRPEHWFVPYAGAEGEPYGIPWGWIPDLLIAVPASLDEGVLITGPDRSANVRRVRFVMLHEFGHLASKRLLHPGSDQPYSSVRWFDELLATYFAYAFVRASDPDWARMAENEWQRAVEEFTPPVVSLDWSHFRTLPPAEFARTYAWYQNLLNLRAVTLYEAHGLAFLRSVQDELDWQNAGNWTTDELLPVLDGIAPGFQAWASALERGEATESRP
jgi:hypothetical protein